MFGMFKVEKKINTPAEQRLEEIKSILFPPAEIKQKLNEKDNEFMKYQVDYSIDMNLDAAITDIQSGYTDEVVVNTLNDTLDRLYKVRELLEAHMEIDKDAQYIIVESKREEFEIEASEE